MFYVDENGEKKNPVMVHRAVLGSYERFLVLLLEQFKGVLPLWLSPIQVNIVSINIKYHNEYCEYLFNILNEEDIRVEYDDSDIRFNKKIMNSIAMKNPYTIIVGDNERDNKMVSYREYGSEETKSLSIKDFIELIREKITKDS